MPPICSASSNGLIGLTMPATAPRDQREEGFRRVGQNECDDVLLADAEVAEEVRSAVDLVPHLGPGERLGGVFRPRKSAGR